MGHPSLPTLPAVGSSLNWHVVGSCTEGWYIKEVFVAAKSASKKASSLLINETPAIYCVCGEQDCHICDLQDNSECQSTRSEISSSALDSEIESSKSASVRTASLSVSVNTQRIKDKRVKAILKQKARNITRIIQGEFGIVSDYLSSSVCQ